MVDRKSNGPEKGTLDTTDFAFYESEYERLTAELEAAHEKSNLPEAPTARKELNDLLVRLRLKSS